jgi:hypothetical protein
MAPITIPPRRLSPGLADKVAGSAEAGPIGKQQERRPCFFAADKIVMRIA